MNRLQAAWHWLTEPAPSVIHEQRRRESRLLMTLLVVIGLVWVVIFASLPLVALLPLPPGRLHVVTFVYPMLLFGVAPPMFGSYLLARRGHATWGSRILVVVSSAATFFCIVTTKDVNVLSIPVIALVLCSLLLKPADTAEAFVVIIACYMVLVFGVRQHSLWQVYGALIAVSVTAALSEINVIVRSRDLKMIEKQAQELAAYQSELVEAGKMEAIARLSAGLAHELNNIMSAIQGYAEVIRRKPAESAPRYANLVREASVRAVHLTDGLLSFGQQQLLHLERIDVNDLLPQHRDRLSAGLGPTTHLVVRASSEAIVVQVDIDQFCKALQALLQQAEKHISGPGTIVVRTSRAALGGTNEFLLPAGDYCRISIADSGPATDPRSVTQLFDPFFTTEEFGTGNLKLAAAWGILRQCGGQVVVKSDATEGNRIQIALPCASGRDAKTPDTGATSG